MAKSKPTKMLAVLGRCRRGGRWQPAAKSSVLAVLGDCYLDMRKALVDEEQPVKFQVTVCLGSVTFIVPPGVEIRPSGMSILASSRVAVPTADETGFPLIEVEWTCILGRIRIISSESLGDEAANATMLGVPAGVAVAPGVVVAPGMVPAAGQMVGAVPTAAPAQMAAAAPVATAPAVAGVGFGDIGAPAEATPAAAGVGFADIGAPASPYAAATEIPSLTEAMASVKQGEAIPAEAPGFLDFAASDDDDDDDFDDDDFDDGDAIIGQTIGEAATDSDGGDPAPSKPAPAASGSGTPSGPPSNELGFADLLAG